MMNPDYAKYTDLPGQYCSAAKEDEDMNLISQWLQTKFGEDFSGMNSDLILYTQAASDMVAFHQYKERGSAGKKPAYALLEPAREILKNQQKVVEARKKMDQFEADARKKNVPFLLETPLSEQIQNLRLDAETEMRFLQQVETWLLYADDQGAAFSRAMALPDDITEEYYSPSISYSSLSQVEIAGYKYWRKYFRKGIPMVCNLDYPLLFARELMSGFGAGSLQEALNLLVDLVRYYSLPKSGGPLARALCEAVAAFCFHFRFPLPEDAFDVFPQAFWYDEIYDLWINAALLDPAIKVIPAKAIYGLTLFDFRSGVAWNQDADGLLEHLRAMMDYMDQRYREQKTKTEEDTKGLLPGLPEGGGLLSEAGSPVDCSFSFLPYTFYLPRAYIPSGRIYQFRHNKKWLSALGGSADNTFRKLNGLKGARSAKFHSAPESIWVSDFQKARKAGLRAEALHEKTVLELDPALISRLRRESDQVREALKTEEDRKLTQEDTENWLASLDEETRNQLFSLLDEQAPVQICQNSLAEKLKTLEESLNHPLFVISEKTGTENWNSELVEFIQKSRLFEEWKKQKRQAAASSSDSPAAALIETLPETTQDLLRLIAAGKAGEAADQLLAMGSFPDVFAEEINDLFLDAGLDALLLEDENTELIINPDLEEETDL